MASGAGVHSDDRKESDNLVSLHSKVWECDTVLTHMEALLSGFQIWDPFENRGGCSRVKQCTAY